MRKSIHSQDYRALVALMRKMREERGFSQEHVAQKLGITASQLSKWERNERRIDASELRLYCEAIEVPLGDLVKEWEGSLGQS